MELEPQAANACLLKILCFAENKLLAYALLLFIDLMYKFAPPGNS